MIPPKVFISHATEDKERFVIPFAKKLRENGVDAWVDIWEIKPGDNLVEKVFENGIKNSQAMIIVLSSFSVITQWVREQLDVGIIKRISGEISIIPIIIDNCTVPEALRTIDRVEIHDMDNYDGELNGILSTIFSRRDKPPIGKTPNRFREPNVQETLPSRINFGIRFLDALDSVRFSSQNANDHYLELSVLYVKMQFFLAMICGDSIVVSENQLFDSLGFLETFNELIDAQNDSNHQTDLPIKLALRSTNKSAYQAVANSIGNESFVLTLWKSLDNNVERRKSWAEYMRKEQKPIEENVTNDEKELMDKLWVALEYFNPSRCVVADIIPSEFSARVKRVMDLKIEDLEDLYTGRSRGVEQRRYFTSKAVLEAAKEIRNALIEIQKKAGEIRSRSLILKEILNYGKEDLQNGVIEFINGVYNQTLGIATKATLTQTSTFPRQENNFVIAGYSLSTYVQDRSNPLNININWEIYSFDYFMNLEGLDYPRGNKDIILVLKSARNNVPWRELIAMQENREWQFNLIVFRNTLAKMKSVEKILTLGSIKPEKRRELEIEREKNRKELWCNWNKHIEIARELLGNEYWEITPTEISLLHPQVTIPIHISYSYLKTKVDMEGDEGFKNWRHSQSLKGRLDESAE